MKKLIIAIVVPLALVAGGCDRKTDAPKPKTGMTAPTSPTSSAGQVTTKRVRLLRI